MLRDGKNANGSRGQSHNDVDLDVAREIKPRTVRWAGQVTHIQVKRNSYR